MKCLFFDTVSSDMKELLGREKPADVELVFWDELQEDERETTLSTTEAVLTAIYKIPRALMEKMPKLRIVQKAGVGTDNIDSQAATELGIAVGNVPGGNANGVVELTMALILDLYRHLPELNKGTKEGKWMMFTYRASSFEVRGKTHGIIGLGNIGREVARLSQAFGSSVLYYDAFRAKPEVEEALNIRFASLEELLREADIVSVHVPLLPETTHLINAKNLALMKKNAVLINVSRGNVVNEQDLYQALVEKKLAGAAIDVWATEPIDPANPLLTLDNVIATPHVAGGTYDAAINVYRGSFANIGACLRGEAFQVLNPDYKK